MKSFYIFLTLTITTITGNKNSIYCNLFQTDVLSLIMDSQVTFVRQIAAIAEDLVLSDGRYWLVYRLFFESTPP